MGDLYRRYGKRTLDLVGATVALVVLSPLLVTVALLVRARLGAPVLFRQLRPGMLGRPFTVVKFRTMRDGRNAAGRLLPDCERLDSFGRFLRRTSLDELPELWNILRGDLSFVGPRPLLMQYLPRYTAEQARRHEVRPGITGLAQVNGRNALTWDARFRLDVSYVDHLSLGLDLSIIAKTLWVVVTRKGVSASGHATMYEFLGRAAEPGAVVDAPQASDQPATHANQRTKDAP